MENIEACENVVADMDVALVLGSSMGTAPFSTMALRAKRVYVVTLGRTAADSEPNVRKINAKCDKLVRFDDLTITIIINHTICIIIVL